jgi:hypothetical protein
MQACLSVDQSGATWLSISGTRSTDETRSFLSLYPADEMRGGVSVATTEAE